MPHDIPHSTGPFAGPDGTSVPRQAPPPPGPPPAEFPQATMPETPERTPLRVVVTDDNPVVRAGLTALLSGREDIQVVEEAGDGREAFEAAKRHHPDVVLLDVRMPGVDGLSVLPYLTALCPVMMLTYSREDSVVHEALRRGAGGYLVHGEFTADQLVAGVRDIKAGRPSFTASASQALLSHFRGGPGESVPATLPDGLGTAVSGGPANRGDIGSPPEPAPPLPTSQPVATGGRAAPSHAVAQALSSREREVMELIASGMSNADIAASCFISEKTVKNHINRIFTKLQAGSRSEAIAFWLGTARAGGGFHG